MTSLRLVTPPLPENEKRISVGNRHCDILGKSQRFPPKISKTSKVLTSTKANEKVLKLHFTGMFIKFFWRAHLRISGDVNCFIDMCQPVTWMAIITWNLTARIHKYPFKLTTEQPTNLRVCNAVYERICRLNNAWNCLLSSKSGQLGTITLPFLNCFSHGQRPVSWCLLVMSYPFSIRLLDTVSPPWCCWTSCPLFPGTSAS